MNVNNSFYFIVNPASNTGRLKKQWPKLLPMIEDFMNKNELEFEYTYTEHPLHSMKLAEKAEEMGYRKIVAVGGDGIANEIGNYILQNDRKIILGLLPLGTSNDLHSTINLKQDIDKCLEILKKQDTKRFAVGKITGDIENSYYFLDHADCGLTALTALSARDGWKILKGESKYTFHALKKLVRFKKNPAEITIDDETIKGELSVVAAGFGDMMGGYQLWPGNNRTMNGFGVILGMGQSRIALLKLMIAAEKGNHLDKPGITYTRGNTIDIYLERIWPFQAEGEIFTEASKEIHFEYIPQKLEIITCDDLTVN